MSIVLLGLIAAATSLVQAEEEPPKPPEPPQVLMSVPLGGIQGETINLKARGLRLEETSEVRCGTEGVTAKFLAHSKVGIPQNLDAARAGDTQVEFELTVAEGVSAEFAELVFVAPHGEATYQLPLAHLDQTILEVEPNDGFHQPQEIELPRVVLGRIERVHDVDVYAVQLDGGVSLRIEVDAKVHGSAMDPLVTLTDERGITLSTNDDRNEESRDSRIEYTTTQSGRYLIVVQDANDLGGEAHPYRLVVTEMSQPVHFMGDSQVSFVRQIAPILRQQCVVCHGPRKAEGGYRLDSYHHLRLAGDSGSEGFAPHSTDDSESFRRITSSDAGERMPLDGQPLSADQVALIQQWLEEGALFDGTDPNGSLLSQIPPVTHPAAPELYSAPVPLTAIAFSPDGTELLVGGYYEITVWDPTEGTLLRRIGQVGQRTHALTWRADGAQFAVACGTPGQLGEVRLFSPSGELLRVLAPSADVIHDVAYSPDGSRLAVARSDGSIGIYDVSEGTLLLEISSHLDWVLSVAWSPDGSKLASGSRDKTAKVYNAETGQLLASYLRHNAAVRGVLFHPSGVEVYSSGENHRWDRWQVEEAKWVKDMHLGGEGFKLFGVGEFFLVPSANNRVHLMKAHESDRVRELHGSGDRRMLSATAHEQLNRIAAGDQRGEVTLWELSTGEKITEFRAYPAAEKPE